MRFHRGHCKDVLEGPNIEVSPQVIDLALYIAVTHTIDADDVIDQSEINRETVAIVVIPVDGQGCEISNRKSELYLLRSSIKLSVLLTSAIEQTSGLPTCLILIHSDHINVLED